MDDGEYLEDENYEGGEEMENEAELYNENDESGELDSQGGQEEVFQHSNGGNGQDDFDIDVRHMFNLKNRANMLVFDSGAIENANNMIDNGINESNFVDDLEIDFTD